LDAASWLEQDSIHSRLRAKPFVLTALTRDPTVIQAADLAGVDRIGIDIERLGKDHRQSHKPELRFSDHRLEDLQTVSANVRKAEIFARLNPLHAGTRAEIEQSLALGARAIMLPFFTSPEEAASFVEMIAGRAKPLLLVETAAAVKRIREIVTIDGVNEIMVGLNDLHLSLGLGHPFEVLLSDGLYEVAEQVRGAGLRFGFGGVARFDDPSLPVSPDLILAQYALLGGATAWLSRSFFRGLPAPDIPEAVQQLRHRLDYWTMQPTAALERQRDQLAAALRAMKAYPA